ncbi:thiosulfate sulfurtransferase/rhodanese-like domain-containing protein 3 isoform X4 [Ochotona curzoniae]|uniref:thiosulfate sulfurtransferase/rhodanese-like domain-containing protein 3 isoform X4 n=1 Tax=Ochotona curzoniae TaxID=130825 RepID=UPI001B34C8D7|nr:thiosulfate sulfurtransferase/rhodanese-like domain-containing protein 3 isoform X4 [Ochotona curzoniae]
MTPLGSSGWIWLVSWSCRICLKSTRGSCHNFCTAASKYLTYKELKNLLNSKNIMLIDVREPWEILEYGKIPGSVNIPLDELDLEARRLWIQQYLWDLTVLNTMLEGGRNGYPANLQRRKKETEF